MGCLLKTVPVSTKGANSGVDSHQIMAAGLAATGAAFVTSRFGVAGTLLGAALTAMTSTGGARRPAGALRAAGAAGGASRAGGAGGRRGGAVAAVIIAGGSAVLKAYIENAAGR